MIRKNRARNKSGYYRKCGNNSYYTSFSGFKRWQRFSYTKSGCDYVTSISMCNNQTNCIYECSTTELSKGSIPR